MTRENLGSLGIYLLAAYLIIVAIAGLASIEIPAWFIFFLAGSAGVLLLVGK